jgi:hypothetical protein
MFRASRFRASGGSRDLRRIEPEERHAPHVQPHVVRCIHEAQQHVLASGASRHKAGALHVHTSFGKSPGHATKRTLSLRSRNIDCEYSAQFTGGGVPIKIVGTRIHFRSPVGPKRSVRIRSGLWPQAVRRLAAFSTNDVGPQT